MSQTTTKRQNQLLDFIKKYSEKNGVSPSLEEMADALGLSSLSSVHYHLSKLEERGIISRNSNTYRSVRIDDDSETITEIPLVGTIAAGHPIEAFEETEPISVPKTMLSEHGEHFALRVSGDSMIDDGIFDMDIVVIRKQEYANDGDTIVAIINGNEATLKRLYKERDGFRLQPANPNMDPIFTKELLVQGKVASVMRNIDNKLITTPVNQNVQKYIRSDEYVNDKTLQSLSDAILKFKRKNITLYQSEKDLDLAILQEIFIFLLGNQKNANKIRKNIFVDFSIKSLDVENKDKLQQIFSHFGTNEYSDDVLGHIYQNMQSQENRKESGQYYTPNKVVNFIVDNIEVNLSKKRDLKVLDPACGSGQFLIGAYEKLLKEYEEIGITKDDAHIKIVEEHLFGIDIDPVACLLAKANLILKNPNIMVSPNIHTNNFLKRDYGLIDIDPFNFLYKKIDFIIGNPPWGASLTKEDKKYFAKYYEIGSAGLNTFTLFMERSLEFLGEKSRLGFLIPEAYLKIKVHQASRKQLLSSGLINLLAISGDIFKKVYAPALVLIFEKTKSPKEKHKIIIQEGVFNGGITETQISQSLFDSTPDNIFNIHFSDVSTKVIQHIASLDNKYLKDNTLFVLGIVTGNNKKYLVSEKLSKQHESIVVGKDVSKFKIGSAKNYFVYDKDVLQQVAPKDYYENQEKLIYKFIGKNLTLAYDNKKRFSLNNANAIVPNIPNLDIKYILGILNSELIQFYYSKLFFTVRVLRGNLERLPIFNATKAQQKKLIRLVEEVEKSNDANYNNLLQKLNDYVYELYDISKSQKEYIEKELLSR